MKPSGIEWIGDIPDDWEVTKIGQLYLERNEKVSDREYEALSVTKHGILKQLESAAKSDNGDNRKLVKSGDFVINSRSDRRGSCGISKFDGSVSLINIILMPTQKIANGYYNYLFRTENFADEFYKYGNGIVDDLWSTKWTSMKKILVPFPSLRTQQRIADYLDEKCGEIDATIAKQKESIEKLKAYKQSLISETVTKGLDKSAPLKPSGIEWIGDIPAHWEVIKTKFLFNVYGGSTPKVNVPEYWGDKITWITPGELGDDIKIVLNSKRMLSEKGLNSCGATLVSKGSIIISNRAPIGQVCLAGSELCTNQGCKSLVAKIKLSCLFFYYFFKVQSEVLNMLGNGTTFMELSTSDLLNFKIPCPTIKEQQKIADYLDSKCSQIDKYITEKQNIIQKLDTYKKSLIFECVTGKQKI